MEVNTVILFVRKLLFSCLSKYTVSIFPQRTGLQLADTGTWRYLRQISCIMVLTLKNKGEVIDLITTTEAQVIYTIIQFNSTCHEDE